MALFDVCLRDILHVSPDTIILGWGFRFLGLFLAIFCGRLAHGESLAAPGTVTFSNLNS